MDVEIKHKPGFAVIHANLLPGDSITAESDAMASMSTHLKVKTRFNGGLFKGLIKKYFGSESLFINEFICPVGQKPGDITLTQPTPGDIEEMDLNGETFFLQPGAYIAHSGNVKLGVKWAGIASGINKEGFFKLAVSGRGKVYYGAYGCLFKKKVSGEFIVDTGHLVGYTSGLKLKLGLAGGIFSSFFGGEGLVTKVKGEGEIILQSRNLEALGSLTSKLF
ncbi:MAG: TIGR00266 family protein [Planctomycetota bacterium]|nr:MAG: TIGR00266 family protein [Planctomycetota bacterium]